MRDAEVLAGLRAAVLAVHESGGVSVRVHNQRMDAVSRECARVAQTIQGRHALEQAARCDADPQLRLYAANAVARWDTVAGAAALAGIIAASGQVVQRPMTMTAALAVTGQPAGDAALCLMNLDARRGVGIGAPAMATAPAEVVGVSPVSEHLLDAAVNVYSLTTNGGLAHAWQVASTDFVPAEHAFTAVGLVEAARTLKEASALLTLAPSEPDGLDPEVEQRLYELEEHFTDLPDILRTLEAAPPVLGPT